MKEAMVLFGDEVEVRDQYVATIAQGFVITEGGLPFYDATAESVKHIATKAFELAEAMIEIRRQRTVYTCSFCGKVALKPGSERCPECAATVCVRCKRPFGELHHICIREMQEVAR